MARLNDFMVRADLTPMVEYCREFGVAAVYEKGEAFVAEGSVCRYVGLVLSGYFKYSMLDTSGNECIAGFGFENEIITDFVRSVQYSGIGFIFGNFAPAVPANPLVEVTIGTFVPFFVVPSA